MKKAFIIGVSLGTLVLIVIFLTPSKTPLQSPVSRSLSIVAHSSFTGSLGPGPLLKQEFEKTCVCNVKLINGGDAGVLLQRLKLDPNFSVDVLMGLDQFSVVEAQRDLKWKPIKKNLYNSLDKRIPLQKKGLFLPYDWSPMVFIYRKGEVKAPETLGELVKEEFKGAIALQDPRSSTPGLQFLYWVFNEKGDKEFSEYFVKLQGSLHSVSPSWSAAYGLFQKKQAKLVFSYLTSLIYHWKEDKDLSYQAALFKEGQPVQVEYLGIADRCKECGLAEKWTEFVLTPKAQKIIAENNYMLPVVEGANLHASFSQLPIWKNLETEKWIEFFEKKKELIKRWEKSSR